MLRPFSAFPGGWAGVGLLGLRFALLVILIGGVAPSIGIRVVLVCAGAMVMAGFFTSFASGVAAAVALGAYSVDARLFGWRELHVPDP